MEKEFKPVIITGTSSEIAEGLKKLMAMTEITKQEPASLDFKLDKMTVSEASQFIEVSYVTLNKWIRDGKIPVHGSGRTRFILKSELIEAYKRMQ